MIAFIRRIKQKGGLDEMAKGKMNTTFPHMTNAIAR
jgi:hypothetical protein